MYIRNRRRLNVEPWGIHAITSAKEEICPLSTTPCFRFLKKLNNRFKILSDMPFCFSLSIMSSCHTLSNALRIATHLVIYGLFFIRHMDIFLDHIMSLLIVQI